MFGHDDRHIIRDKKVLLVKISENDFSVHVVHRAIDRALEALEPSLGLLKQS